MVDSIRVLHVEDDAEFAEVAAELLALEEPRIEVRTVHGPEAGLGAYEQEAVDCVVTDYQMPGENGIEFIERIHRDDPDLPCILFTGQGSEEIASEAISRGVNDYLQKGGRETYALLANRIVNLVGKYRNQQRVNRIGERFRLLVEESTDVIMIVDAEGVIEYATQAAESILGRAPEDLVGTSGFALIHPADREAVADEFARLATGPADRRRATFRYEHADGSWIWVEARGRDLLDRSAIGGIVVYARDVTERMEREHERRELLARLEFALEATGTGVWDWNVETGEVVWDENLERLLGVEPGSFAGTLDAFTEYVHPADLSEVERAMEAAIDGDGEFHEEFRMQRTDGEEVWVRGHGRRFGGADGDRIIGITSDITDQKEREWELERQNRRLDEFASMMSHDIRNPLSLAMGHLARYREAGDDSALDMVAEALDRIDSLTTELTTLARDVEPVTSTEPTSLPEVAERAWAMIEPRSATLSTEDATIAADPDQLQALLENLFRNAIGHGGADVTVRVGPLADGFYVEDTGSGIPPEIRETVFDHGFTTGYGGSGVGLTVVRRIAAAHDLEISLEASPEGGARFEFTRAGSP